jgi:hypothetical protein
LVEDKPYTIYASVYQVGPPHQTIMSTHILVIDELGRQVADLGGGTIGEYAGRYTNAAAKLAVVRHVNGIGGTNLSEEDVHLISEDEAVKLDEESKRGGFQVFALIENVPNERALYLKGLYLLEFGNRPWKKSGTFDMIRTSGEEDDAGVKKVMVQYLKSSYGYWVEPGEIHFITERQKEEFEELTA